MDVFCSICFYCKFIHCCFYSDFKSKYLSALVFPDITKIYFDDLNKCVIDCGSYVKGD